MKKLQYLTLTALAVSVSSAFAQTQEESQAQPLGQHQATLAPQIEANAPTRYIIKFKNNGNAVQASAQSGQPEL